MKYQFGKRSRANLATCHLDLQLVAREGLAMGLIDFCVICGHRDEADQNKAYPKNSSAQWPNSKHNSMPSNAYDLAHWIHGHIPWEETDKDYWSWYYLGGIIMAAAKKLGINIVWGRNFKVGKGDLGHFQRGV